MEDLKITINVEKLRNLLAVVSMPIVNNAIIPVMETIKFQVEDGLTLSSTSDDIGVQINAHDASVSGSGGFCIPAKKLVEMVKKLNKKGDITISHKKGSPAHVNTQNGKYEIGVMGLDEFPNMFSPDSGDVTLNEVFSTGKLMNGLNSVVFSASAESLRPIMMGVNMEMHDNEYVFVATDTHRLAINGKFSMDDKVEYNFVIPTRAVQTLTKAIPILGPENITVDANTENISFGLDNTVITARLRDGKYPSWRNVMPMNNPIKLSVNIKELYNAVSRVDVFSSEATHMCTLSADGTQLTVKTNNPESSSSGVETVTLGEPVSEHVEIGFNGTLLQGILKEANKDENMFIYLKDSKTAALMKTSNGNNTYILMPIML